MTASGATPGLKTSTSEEPPAASWAWGMAQAVSGRAAPGTRERPPEEPENTCTSDATTRPVRVATTVLTVATSCTSDATFSTWTWPAWSTIPW